MGNIKHFVRNDPVLSASQTYWYCSQTTPYVVFKNIAQFISNTKFHQAHFYEPFKFYLNRSNHGALFHHSPICTDSTRLVSDTRKLWEGKHEQQHPNQFLSRCLWMREAYANKPRRQGVQYFHSSLVEYQKNHHLYVYPIVYALRTKRSPISVHTFLPCRFVLPHGMWNIERTSTFGSFCFQCVYMCEFVYLLVCAIIPWFLLSIVRHIPNLNM